MKKQNQKQLEERIAHLESQLSKRKVQRKKWYLLPVFLLTLAFTAFWVYHSIKTWGLFDIFGMKPEEVTFEMLIVIPNALFNYVLIGLSAITFCAWRKNGFEKLRRYSVVSLIGGLVAGLVFGLVLGLAWGLVLGLVLGLAWGLVGEFER